MLKVNGLPMRDLFGSIEYEPIKIASPSELNTTLQGRYAEYMVCAYLTKMGYIVMHIDTTGYDLILDHNGHSLKIDVKSTNTIFVGKRKETIYWNVGKANRVVGKIYKHTRRLTTESDCDILALFWNSIDAVAFHPVTRPLKRIALPVSQLRSDPHGEQSLKAALVKKLGEYT